MLNSWDTTLNKEKEDIDSLGDCMNESPKHRKVEAVNKSTGYTIYHRHNHDVPLAARQDWALTLERMKRNAESRGMIATLEFIELDNTTISYLSVVSEKGEAPEEIPDSPDCADIREIAEMYERYRNTEKCKSR